MKSAHAKTRTVAALAVLIAASALLSNQAALACSPEVKLDQITGAALPQADLAAAVAELDGSIVVVEATR